MPASDACHRAARRKPPASLPACVPLDAAPAGSLHPGTSKHSHRSAGPGETGEPPRPIAGQFRDRLRAHHFAGQGGHYPPHLPRADPAQKCLPDQQRDLLRPPLKRLQTTGQKALLASTRNPQPDGAEAGHKIPLVVAVAIDSPSATPPFVPPPARIAIALPLRLQLEKPLPG